MNNITRLPENAFKNFPYLEELRLAGNDLAFIHPKALSGLKELKVLTLQNNQLKTIPKEAIRGLSGLQSLRLDANHITIVPEDSFEGLVQLRHLWLDDNSLTEVPVIPLSNLPSLQALTLALNKITHIPDFGFRNLSSLVVLDLNYNSMVEFPEAIKSLPSIKELGFHSNYISMIPDNAFIGNPLLRTIHLYDNPLSFVGNSAFQNLSDLHSLTFTGAKISNIPTGLCQEQKILRTLDLSYNNIKELPHFKGCNSLEEIYLQHNQIEEIKEDTFQGFTSLHTLDLSRNLIHRVNKEAFTTLGAITNLDLSFNMLTSFPTGGLSRLKQLKLIGNIELKETLSPKDFTKLSQALENVNIDFNYKVFPEHIFEKSVSKKRCCLKRSLSVPYAYQCCPFWGCDSYLNSNPEDPSLQNQSREIINDQSAPDVDDLSSAEVKESGQTVTHCTPTTGAFKPCEYLLGSWMIRLTVWFIFLVALLFNMLVILSIFVSSTSLPSIKMFIGLISISNLLMGIYTGILTFLDAVSWGRFAEFGIWWETGNGCKVARFLAIFSSEGAIFFLLLATIERSLSAKEIIKKGKSSHQNQFRIAAVFAFLCTLIAACLPVFHKGEYSGSPLCLPFPTGEAPSLGFTVTLVLLNSLAFLLMAVIYTKLYCKLEKEDLSKNNQASMIKHVAWLIFTNCIFFCPVAFFSFAPLITAIAISPEIMKSVTLIFFPLPACLNPVLYVFFNPKFKEDWKLLRWHITKRNGTGTVAVNTQTGCRTQDFYYDCSMYTHLQGSLTMCECCESLLISKPAPCKHLVKSHSCPTLTVVPCQRPDGCWSDCGTQSAHSDYADEEDSFVSDSSDQVQACGRACFYQSRGFPLVRYAYNTPRIKD
ncbi:hypothetical protein E2320_021019 [Naja naja]|nr:hypothetical protein E2320_021019 [Naja naja]